MRNISMGSALVGLFFLASPAVANTYYVAPLGATLTCSGSGTQSCPWSSVAEALKSGVLAGGDTVNLLDGDHGRVVFNLAQKFVSPVVFQSLNAKAAHLDELLIQGGNENLTFRNLSVWPTDPYAHPSYLVRSYATSKGIIVDSLDVRAGQDAANYMSWTQTEWLSRQTNGAFLESPDSQIINSVFTGISTGMQIAGANSLIANNVVDGFSADGMRANGDNGVVKNNKISNCFQIDTNHADGFQSFVPTGDLDGAISGLTIENNTIIEWTNSANNALRCSLQGIGMFDGWYDNVMIRNNVVAVSAYHGISLYGTRGSSILNNTVVNVNGATSGQPWVTVKPHKNGSPSTDVLVANNLATKFVGSTDTVNRITYAYNSDIGDPAAMFEDPVHFNYRPKSGTVAIDTAGIEYAPALDIVGAARPYGAGPDRGAYEVGVVAATTTTTTTSTSTSTTTTTTTTTSPGGAKFVRVSKKK